MKDYPKHREDWLMVEEYAKQKSIFGCILCDKTHSRHRCEHKARRTAPTPPPPPKNKTQDEYEDYYNPNNYGW